jgi:hypothetical protein
LLFVFWSLFVWPLHCVYGLCLLCRSLFGPCSFDHCIVQETNNDLQSKHKPYTQCNGQTNKDRTTIYKVNISRTHNAMVKRTRTKRRTTIYKVNISRTHTAYVYFVDRCSSFSPCSFDHCIVCTDYVYFVDRCSVLVRLTWAVHTMQWSNEQGPKNEQRSTK